MRGQGSLAWQQHRWWSGMELHSLEVPSRSWSSGKPIASAMPRMKWFHTLPMWCTKNSLLPHAERPV